MQKITHTLVAVALLLLPMALVGCATVSQQEVAAARFDPLPKDYQARIKAKLNPLLKDPYSAVYRFDPPRKGFSQDGLVQGGKKHFGYVVPTYVNAKNGFGGYSGEELYPFMYADGEFYNIADFINSGMGGFIP